MNTPSFRPVCPNHSEPLEGLPFPLPEQGRGICPVSGVPFEFTAHVDEEVAAVDKFGNKSKQLKWEVQGNE